MWAVGRRGRRRMFPHPPPLGGTAQIAMPSEERTICSPVPPSCPHFPMMPLLPLPYTYTPTLFKVYRGYRGNNPLSLGVVLIFEVPPGGTSGGTRGNLIRSAIYRLLRDHVSTLHLEDLPPLLVRSLYPAL